MATIDTSGHAAHGLVSDDLSIEDQSKRPSSFVVVLLAFAALLAGLLIAQRISGREVSTVDRNARIIPLALGGDTNVIGTDPSGSDSNMLWASIAAPYTPKEFGDPYSTKCSGASHSVDKCDSPPNLEYRQSGYLYGISVGEESVGKDLVVELYDAGHYNRDRFPHVETADYTTPGTTVTTVTTVTNGSVRSAPVDVRSSRNGQPVGTSYSGAPGLGVTTSYELLSSDANATDASDNASLAGGCSSGPGTLVLSPETDGALYKNQWSTLCALNAAAPGTYVLRVTTSNIPGVIDSGNGFNQYSVRATSTGDVQPSVFAIGDISIFVNPEQGRQGADYVLAQVPTTYAGSTLRVQLFDPGDGESGSGFTTVQGPDGNAPPCTFGIVGRAESQSVERCMMQTRSDMSGPNNGIPNPYNDQWVVIQIDLPTDYACGSNCWWRIRFDWDGVANDRATWTAHILESDDNVSAGTTIAGD